MYNSCDWKEEGTCVRHAHGQCVVCGFCRVTPPAPEYKAPDVWSTLRRLADPECRDVPAHVRRAVRQTLHTVDALTAADWCAWAAKHRAAINIGSPDTAEELTRSSEWHLKAAYRKA